MTVKELAAELNISEQALRQWCKKNNVRKERTQGTKATYCFDFDTIEQARAHYSSESKESKATKEHNQSNESKESKTTNETKDSESKNDSTDDLQKAFIEHLQAEIEELKADKAYLQERLTAAEQERDTLTKERQTILAELLELKQPKVIELKPAPAQEPARAANKRPSPAPRSERQQPRKRTIQDTLRSWFRRKP